MRKTEQFRRSMLKQQQSRHDAQKAEKPRLPAGSKVQKLHEKEILIPRAAIALPPNARAHNARA
jgi:hypothetical protein